MTDKQWERELGGVLVGTCWSVEWSGVATVRPTFLADVRDSVNNRHAQIELSRDVFRTMESRAAEVRRQLP